MEFEISIPDDHTLDHSKTKVCIDVAQDVKDGFSKPVYVTNILNGAVWPNETMGVIGDGFDVDKYYHNSSGFTTNFILEKNSSTDNGTIKGVYCI
jgi:hypothetical protein